MYLDAVRRTTVNSTMAPRFQAIFLTLASEKTVAFWRAVISARRGCCHWPGLSVTCALFLTGVVMAVVEDIVPVPDRERMIKLGRTECYLFLFISVWILAVTP